MAKKSFLNSISSPSPCAENWDKMIGDERVRFCQSCEKNIYNISAMPRKQVKKLILEKNGKICIRYERRTDGSIITADRKIYRITRTSRIAAGVLGASLVVSALTNAQTAKTENVSNKSAQTQKQNKNTSRFSLTLFDPNGTIISEFRVQMINQTGGKIFIAVSDENGIARFDALPFGRYEIIVEAQKGFSQFKKFIELKHKNEPNVEITIEVPSATVGIFVYDWSEIPLFRAIAQDDDEAVFELINNGFDINTKDKDGQTALHVAVEHGNLEIVRFLLDKGAKVNVRDKSKRTPFQMVFSSIEDDEENKKSIIRLLVFHGADINLRDEDGETFLMLACEDDDLEGARFFLELGANPNLKDEDGETAYQKTDSDEIKQLLIQYGARVEN